MGNTDHYLKKSNKTTKLFSKDIWPFVVPFPKTFLKPFICKNESQHINKEPFMGVQRPKRTE